MAAKVTVDSWQCRIAIFLLGSCLLPGCGGQPVVSKTDFAPGEKLVQVPVAEDLGWPNIFGPFHDSSTLEQDLLTEWPDSGPPVLWRKQIGVGYSVPVVWRDQLVLFHRLGDEEVVECLRAETGEPLWQHRYPTDYKCTYEYSNGPYCTPVIEEGRVWSVGAEGKLYCLAMLDGEVLWQRDLVEEFEIAESLFGVGCSPLLEGESLILNVGGSRDESGIVALDKSSGETLWSKTEYRASYCTPVAATIHQQRYLFMMAFEGLVALDPSDGNVFWHYPFQRKTVDSVNATTPLVVGDRVFIATGPGTGCRCLRILPDKSFDVVWKGRRNLDSQFNNLLQHRGYVYGYTSKWNRGATFNCVELHTGDVRWRHASELMRGSSIRTDSHFILWGELGHLASMKINAEQPQLLCQTSEPLLAAPCFTAPALSRGLLYLRNEQELLCLDLRLK